MNFISKRVSGLTTTTVWRDVSADGRISFVTRVSERTPRYTVTGLDSVEHVLAYAADINNRYGITNETTPTPTPTPTKRKPVKLSAAHKNAKRKLKARLDNPEATVRGESTTALLERIAGYENPLTDIEVADKLESHLLSNGKTVSDYDIDTRDNENEGAIKHIKSLPPTYAGLLELIRFLECDTPEELDEIEDKEYRLALGIAQYKASIGDYDIAYQYAVEDVFSYSVSVEGDDLSEWFAGHIGDDTNATLDFKLKEQYIATFK